SVLLGTGTGSFAPHQTTYLGGSPRGIITDDFNMDGKPDIALTNSQKDSVTVLLSTGTATFSLIKSFKVGSSPQSLTKADFDGDNVTDLAVANTGSNNISVLLGTGTGSFIPAVNFMTANSPASLMWGNFNGDTKKDLAVSNSGSNNVSILLNCTVLGIKKYEMNEELSLFPNPCNGQFSFQLNKEIEKGKMIIVNSLGQQVNEQKIINGKNEINVRELTKGLYNYMIFENNFNIANGKLIID
ncbi:MAG: FG-GAP-like repeat-containing protein, partial [Bacteroidia bacterium]